MIAELTSVCIRAVVEIDCHLSTYVQKRQDSKGARLASDQVEKLWMIQLYK